MSLTIRLAEIVEQSSSPLIGAHPDWSRVPLGSVVSIVNGAAFKSAEFTNGDGMPLIRIRDIGHTDTTIRYTGAYEERYLVRPGELLVGMDGDFHLARWQGREALLNQRVCCLRPDAARLDVDFLTHVLPGYLQAIHDVTSSTTVKHLSSRDIADIPIPLPSLSEQHRIAARLDEIDARRSSIADRLAVARVISERLRRAVLAAACSGRVTAEWREQNVSMETAAELAHQIARGRREPDRRHARESGAEPGNWTIPDTWVWTTPEQLRNSNRSLTYGVIKLGPSVDDGVPTLRSSNVRWLRIENDHVKHISHTIADQYRRTYLDGGEVLVTVRGTLGGVAVVPPEMAGWNVSREVAIVPLVGEVDPMFVAYMIGSPQCQRWLAHVAKGVAYTGVNIADLKELPLPLPPLQEQLQIVNCVTEVLANADRLDAAISGAKTALDGAGRGALAKAFRGGLVAVGTDPTP